MEPLKHKILVVPGYLLYPYETGAGLAQFNFIDSLRYKADVSVLLSPVNVGEEHKQSLLDLWGNVYFHFWNKPLKKEVKPPSISERIVNKISSYKKKFVPIENESQYSEKYNGIYYNIENILKPIPEWMSVGLDDLLKTNTYDLIQFDLPINLGLGSIVAGRAKTLFVHHEIKFKRIRTIIKGDEPDVQILHKLQSQVESREIDQLNNFDAIQVFTEDDKVELIDKIDVPVHVCPFSVSDEGFRESKDNEAFRKLLFIGSDEHEPNLDGLIWLVGSWLPCLEGALPVKIHVIGKWSDDNKKRIKHESIQFEGFVESLDPWWANSVLIAPIRHGAGLRTKILEAMAASVPVITTSFAMQGIEAGGVLNVVEDVKEFEQQINMIYTDKELFNMRQKQVYGCAKKLFSSSAIIDKRVQIIDKTLT